MAVVEMRHNGIALAMQQAYWDKYGVGKTKAAIRAQEAGCTYLRSS